MTRGPIGRASLSRSLGAKDPRLRRNAQAATLPLDVDPQSFTYDELGRLRPVAETPVGDVVRVDTEATVDALVATVNVLLGVLRERQFPGV